jgi:hypothetical protein
VDGENVAVGRVAFRVAVCVLENLDFNSFDEGLSPCGNVVRPDKDAGIPFGNEMPPFEFEDEVLIHAIRADFPDRFSRAGEVSLFREAPGGGGSVHDDPTAEILSVQDRAETGFRFFSLAQKLTEKNREEEKDAHVVTSSHPESYFNDAIKGRDDL